MGKSRFLIPANGEGEESGDATAIGSVEDLCLAHYHQQGFDQGKKFCFRKKCFFTLLNINIVLLLLT